MKTTIRMSQFGVIALLSITVLLFQNCGEKTKNKASPSVETPSISQTSSGISGAVLNAQSMEWIDSGSVGAIADGSLRRYKDVIYDVVVTQEAILSASIFSNTHWSHVDEPTQYFIGLSRIHVNNVKCGLGRNKINIPADSTRRVISQANCIIILSPGTHTVTFHTSAWTNRDDLSPDFKDGHLGFTVIAR